MDQHSYMQTEDHGTPRPLRTTKPRVPAVTLEELMRKHNNRGKIDPRPLDEITDIINREITNAHKDMKTHCKVYVPPYSSWAGLVIADAISRQHILDTFGIEYNVDFSDGGRWVTLSWPKRSIKLWADPGRVFNLVRE